MSHKLLHIVSGDLWGGAEAQMSMQIPAQVEQGLEVAVLCFNDRITAQKYRALGLQVFLSDESTGVINWLKNAHEKAGEFAPTVVIAHGYKEAICAWYLSLRLSCPWIIWFHGISEGYSGLAAIKNWCFQKLQLFLARYSASRAVFVSKDAAKRLGLSKLKTARVIYNVYCPSKEIDDSSDCTAIEFQRPAVVAVGRMTSIKRFDRAIDALQRVISSNELDPAPHLYIIGEGPLSQELQSKAGESQHVHFLGFKDNAANYISAADMLLISSDSEGVPTVLLEALWAQVPVVSCEVGGIAEVLEEFLSYPYALVPRESVAMSDAVKSMLLSGVNRGEFNSDWREKYLQLFSPKVAATSLFLELEEIV